MVRAKERKSGTGRRALGWRATALALILMTAACGPDNPVAPEDLRLKFANGARLVSIAENGKSYTLDLAARELRDASGRIVELTGEQLAQFATMYDEVLYTDYLDGELSNAPAPEEPMCGPNPCYEQVRAERRPDVSAPTPWVFAGGKVRVWLPVGRGRGARPIPRFGVLNGVEAVNETTAPIINSEFPPNCYELALAIYSLRSELKSHRGVIVGVLSSLFEALSFSLRNGQLVAEMPSGFWVGVGLEYVAAEQLARSVALQFLAAQYSGYGCWTNGWDRRDYFEGGVTTQVNASIQKTCYNGVIGLWIDGVMYYFDGPICDLEWVD